MSSEIDNLRNELDRFSNENNQLRRKVLESGDTNKRLVEYENKIALLSQ